MLSGYNLTFIINFLGRYVPEYFSAGSTDLLEWTSYWQESKILKCPTIKLPLRDQA